MRGYCNSLGSISLRPVSSGGRPDSSGLSAFPESPFIVDRTHSRACFDFCLVNSQGDLVDVHRLLFCPPSPLHREALPLSLVRSFWCRGRGPPVAHGHQQKPSSLGDSILPFRSLTTVSDGLGSSPDFWALLLTL